MWFWEFRLVDFWVPRMFRGCVSSAPLPSNIFLTFLSKMMFTTINFKDSIDSVTNIFVHWNLSDISCIARFLPYYQKCHLEQKGKRKVLFTFNKLKSDNVLFLNMWIRHMHKMSRCFFYIFMFNTFVLINRCVSSCLMLIQNMSVDSLNRHHNGVTI